MRASGADWRSPGRWWRLAGLNVASAMLTLALSLAPGAIWAAAVTTGGAIVLAGAVVGEVAVLLHSTLP